MAELVMKNVVKKFGQKQVIHGIDLQVNQGELCVFVGPSGCGKSTLLRMIAGLEETTAGEISRKLTIDVVENLGGVSYAYSTTEGDDLPIIIELRGKTRPRENSDIEIRFSADSVLLFDATNGARIR